MDTNASRPLTQALAAIDAAGANNPAMGAKCRGLLRGYDMRWRAAGYAAESVEQMVTADLYNPETQARSRSFTTAGKLDVVATYHGRRIIFDHKTTSQEIADPNAAYWRQLAIEGQASHYMLLEYLHGRQADHAVWDVVRKPAIRPKKLTKAERASVVGLGSYFHVSVSDDTRQALQADDVETDEMFEARLANDCIHERPEWYFQRRAVPRLEHELAEYAGELWNHAQDMLWQRRQPRLPPRNSGACLLYGTPCKFLGICSGHDTPDSERWRQRENVHPELPDLEGAGRDVLTNSRIRCFQTCRRKEYYQYSLGLERVDDEEREALVFGQLWHTGLNAWWSFFLPKE